MSFIFRTISQHDAETLAQLSLQLGYSVSVAEMQHRIALVLAREDHCGFVAIAEQQVVGWIQGFYAIRLESEPFVEIGALVVSEHQRGQGIGRLLLEQVKDWANERAIPKLRVRCNTKRAGTHTFYRKLGFAESKEQKVLDLVL